MHRACRCRGSWVCSIATGAVGPSRDECWIPRTHGRTSSFGTVPAMLSRSRGGHRTARASGCSAGRGMCWSTERGVGWTPAGLVGALRADPHSSHVIQERLFNHEDLAVLSGGPGLQTVRVMTYIMRSGEPVVLAAFFRSVVGSNWIDNHVHGGTGNLIVDLDHHTGIMLKAQRESPGVGFVEVRRHPDTGRVLAGERIPMWDEVLDLALRSARALRARAHGWMGHRCHAVGPRPRGGELLVRSPHRRIPHE